MLCITQVGEAWVPLSVLNHGPGKNRIDEGIMATASLGTTALGAFWQQNIGQGTAPPPNGTDTSGCRHVSRTTRFVGIMAALLVGACGGGGGGNSSGAGGSGGDAAATTYTIGGTISGLTGSGLVLATGDSTVAPAANTKSFTFPTSLVSGTAYTVSIQSQPAGQTCTISNATGTIGTSNVTSIAVSCVAVAEWIWEGGLTGTDAAGIYGTEGLGADNNAPGARGAAATWTDSSGDLWMFGGYGYDFLGTSVGLLNDLWKYVPSTAQWTWVAGSQFANSVSVYGTEGTAAALNSPGARAGAFSWIDQSGALWLFGGEAFDSASNNFVALNDLWKFQPSTGLWTWVGGSSTLNSSGVYGTAGVAATTNVPGGRYSGASWIDSAGNLWLFGGVGLDGTGAVNNLNDLWKYTPNSGQWTWVGGSNTGGAAGAYGTLGTASIGNVPGARENPTYWVDQSGKLWLFGGIGNAGDFNDLWRYDPSSGLWTWLSGSQSTNALPVFGQQGVPSANTVPGSRDSAVGWVDNSGALWLFGGNGYDSTGQTNDLSDLWKFDPSADRWAWIAGSQSGGLNGTYGALGVAAPTNAPGARYGAVSWTDNLGNFWMFGGNGASGLQEGQYSFDYLNDLWEFGTYISPATTVTLVANPTTVASGGSSTVTWTSRNATACASTGGWTASTATSGTVSTGSLSTTTNYSITCTGAGGTATAAATVTVMATAPTQQTFTYTGVAFNQFAGCTYQNSNICPSGPITASATFDIPAGYTGTVDTSADASKINLAISVAGYGALPAIQPANANLEVATATFTFVDGNIVLWDIYLRWYDPSARNPVVQIASPPLYIASSGSATAADLAEVCLPADCNSIGDGQAYTLTPGTWASTPNAAASAKRAGQKRNGLPRVTK